MHYNERIAELRRIEGENLACLKGHDQANGSISLIGEQYTRDAEYLICMIRNLKYEEPKMRQVVVCRAHEHSCTTRLKIAAALAPYILANSFYKLLAMKVDLCQS